MRVVKYQRVSTSHQELENQTHSLDKQIELLGWTCVGEYKEVEIATGLRGDEGMIEIIAGLQENDEIITFLKEKE